MSSAMTADAAYNAYRSGQNARSRWTFAMVLLVVACAYVASYLVDGALRFNGPLNHVEPYALVFGFAALLGLSGAIAGRTPRSTAFDDTWMALLFCCMVALAILDSEFRDTSGYLLISLPSAVLHRAESRKVIAMQVLALLAAVSGTLLIRPATAELAGFILTLSACCLVSVLVATSVERARRERFQHAHELDVANQDLAARGQALEKANRQLEKLVLTDPLTGVGNRRRLFEILDQEFSRSRRHDYPLTVAVIDIDDFGRVNKLHGMIAGDEVLSAFARALQASLRASDMVCRYGGEEFALVLPYTSEEAAHTLLERIAAKQANTPFGERGLSITFSAGVAGRRMADPDPLATLERADECMRRAKREGKNRVISAGQ